MKTFLHKETMKIRIFIISLIFILTSCRNQNQLSLLVKEWQGKEIIFPSDLVFTKYAKDTIDYKIPKSDLKIVLYIDSMGCTNCKLKLAKWRMLIGEVNSLASQKVPFVFIFQPKELKNLYYLLRRDGIKEPVCIDENNKFQKLNNPPKNLNFSCFLLDKYNRVLCIGNPINNLKIRSLYLSVITGENKESVFPKTTASLLLQDKNIEVGNLKLGDIRDINFSIRNLGDSLLYIRYIETSCGCTSVKYTKQGIAEGNIATCTISYKAKKIGKFCEQIKVIYNGENSPLVFSIYGIVSE